jgi:hypothetical protein
VWAEAKQTWTEAVAKKKAEVVKTVEKLLILYLTASYSSSIYETDLTD